MDPIVAFGRIFLFIMFVAPVVNTLILWLVFGKLLYAVMFVIAVLIFLLVSPLIFGSAKA